MADLLTSLCRQSLLDDESAEVARERLSAGASFDDALFAAFHEGNVHR